MNNEQRRLKGLEDQILKRMSRGDKKFIRTLDDEQLKYVTKELRLHATPVLYEIIPQEIPEEKRTERILRDINRAWSRGEKKLYKKLSDKEQKTLEEAHVYFDPFKYEIDIESED